MPADPAIATCILNQSAGVGLGQIGPDQLAAMFAIHNFEVSIVVAAGRDIPALARKAMAQGSQLVIAGGGDGTINAVARALVGSGAVLGVLPLGTLNHFAKDMKIPLRLEDAVAAIASGKIRHVDTGDVNGHLFLNNSSLGLYPRLVRERERLQQSGVGKRLAFARAMAWVMLRTTQMHVRLNIAGSGKSFRTTAFAFIGNNTYEATGWDIGTRQTMDLGKLWICLAPRRGTFGLLILALRSVMGWQAKNPAEIIETDECWIKPRQSHVDVARDGEVMRMKTPLHYRILPHSLRVMVPEDAPGAM